jgi:site-specific recombinase XerD
VTPLRRRMLEELQRRKYSTDTIRGYLLAVEQFARHFHKSPERMGIQEIGQFQLHLLQEQKLALGTIALRMAALRFLYKKTLKRRALDFDESISTIPWPWTRASTEITLADTSGVRAILWKSSL